MFMASHPQRVYVDSCIFVFQNITSLIPEFSRLSRLFLGKVQSGKYEGIVSIVSLMEFTKQIRELMVKANVVKKSDWLDAAKIAIESIYKMKNVKIIEGNPDERKNLLLIQTMLHSEVAWESFDILSKYPGSVKKDKEIEHDGIHPIDAFHIVLAKRMGCDRIATLDQDFRETDGEIESLLLQEDIF